MKASGTMDRDEVSMKFDTLRAEPGMVSSTYMLHPRGEKRRYQLVTLRSKYGGKLCAPECQKAKIDLDPGTGGPGHEICESREADEDDP
jgi:hypothetical protein